MGDTIHHPIPVPGIGYRPVVPGKAVFYRPHYFCAILQDYCHDRAVCNKLIAGYSRWVRKRLLSIYHASTFCRIEIHDRLIAQMETSNPPRDFYWIDKELANDVHFSKLIILFVIIIPGGRFILVQAKFLYPETVNYSALIAV